MAIIDESELINLLSKSKKVLLLEPPYLRRYVPLGLAKISSFVKSKGGEATYSRRIVAADFDLICVATCFTSDSQIVLKAIADCKRSLFLRKTKIIVGGIFASLMPEYILDKVKGVDIFVGCSDILDNCLPDFDIDYGIDGFFGECDTLFTTRGCPNHCKYCMVWKIEKHHKIIQNWQSQIEKSQFVNIVVSDNNILSFGDEHFSNVARALNRYDKKIIFNNGIDCRLINNDNAKLLASLKYIRSGFRTAFDRMSDDGHYQKGMEKVKKAGLKIKGNSYTYVLFNFTDTPQEAYYRAKECWKFWSNPYLMCYRPLDKLGKKDNYIGKYWTKNLIVAFRYWAQTYGYNRGDKSFENWMKNDANIKLTDEDWDKWHYRK